MAVDIMVLDDVTGQRVDEVEPIRFDNDGYFWHLWPTFELLAAETGQVIDIYEYAEFRGDKLKSLSETLENIILDIHEMGTTWHVPLGIPPYETYTEVKREIMLSLLFKFVSIVEYAIKHDTAVTCMGD